MKVPFFDLGTQFAGLRGEVMAALERACASSSFILGEEVENFEKEFASYCEAKHCVALNSGTSALHLGLVALGVGSGDEVITTPNTFIAVAEAISYTGARPVFVDIDPQTANLDPSKVERAIGPRTKAIVPVHLYGRPADMDSIQAIARRHGVPVFEDACQAHGARCRGRRVGSIGQVAAFSFYPSKNLGAYGEGGALITDDERIATLARALRHHGQTRTYVHGHLGYNYRMEGFQGAILRAKLKRLEGWNARRKEIARLYSSILSGTGVKMPQDDPRDESVYHLFVVYVEDRDAVRAALASRGVQTAVHYPRPIHLQECYAGLGYPAGTFPNAERACERAISMPLFPEMADEQVRYAAKTLAEIGRKK